MRIAILGAGGGLGRNVVDAARAAKHEVVALVRDPGRAELPDEVTTVAGDAARIDDVERAMTGADATLFCVNPPLATWLTTFRPLLECAIAAARRTNTRLVFPANVWIYGPGRTGDLVGESRTPSPTSQRGGLRAEMEQRIAAAGIRYAMVRLPEFYGPSVVTLTARVFRAALADRRALWPGPTEVAIELVYMPDAARVLAGGAHDATEFRRARIQGGGPQAAPVRGAAVAADGGGRFPRDRTRRGRRRPCVDASDPARRHELRRALRRNPPDASRGRDRDDARVASCASATAPPGVTADLAGEIELHHVKATRPTRPRACRTTNRGRSTMPSVLLVG